jgi:hypothetical protein
MTLRLARKIVKRDSKPGYAPWRGQTRNEAWRRVYRLPNYHAVICGKRHADYPWFPRPWEEAR